MGRALFAVQMLEYTLAHFVALVLQKSREEAEQMLADNLRKTLGQLVKRVSKDIQIPGHFSTRLTKFVQERNWLAHHLFAQNSEDLYSMPKFATLVSRLLSVHDEAAALSREFVVISERWCFKHGMTQKQYEAEIDRRLSKIDHS